MNYSNKLKNFEPKLNEGSGITISPWLGIYNMLFASRSAEKVLDGLMGRIQHELNFNERDKDSIKSLKMLCKKLIGDNRTAAKKCNEPLDAHNEIMLSKMSKELMPFAKELIYLAKDQGIHVRLLSGVDKESQSVRSVCDFGLGFDIGVFDLTASGDLIYNGNVLMYANIAKLAESIGLTWAVNQRTFMHQSRFELRPAWAFRMNENEMFNELKRRQEANLNLLAIL
ncbi:MAG: hypothetical protein EOO90_11465 [Pedobacter sp.]|nr:MAG: hypothetical protein EOO90_11465 [Pedobacter sp.]